MFSAASSSTALSSSEDLVESISRLFITLSNVGIFEPGKKESRRFPLDVPDDREAELPELCLDSFADASALPVLLAALAVFVRFTFRDEDLDDELDDEFVLVDAPEGDDVDDEFVVVDAPFDERDDFDDEPPEPFDGIVVAITSIFGSAFELSVPCSSLPVRGATVVFASAIKGLAGRC